MIFDTSSLIQMTNEQIISRCHKITAIPSLIIQFLSFIIFFLFFSFLTVKHSRAKILKILAYTFLCSLIVLLILIFFPVTITQPIVDFFDKLAK